jgi:outer membrane protein insertion porin family
MAAFARPVAAPAPLQAQVRMPVPGQARGQGQTLLPGQKMYRILGVSVQGTAPAGGAEPDAIIANSGLVVGEEFAYPGEKIRQAMQRLWALRLFSEVRISIEQQAADGVYLLITVKEYPRLEQVEFTGYDDLDDDDLKLVVSTVTGMVLSPDDIRRMEQKIRDKYATEGMLLAKVTSRLDTTSTPGRVNLTFEIDEGPTVSIDEIEIVGTSVFSGDDIEAEMEDTGEKSWWQFWASADFDPEKYKADKQRIVDFYRANGYLDAEIASDSTWYTDEGEYISIRMTVYEGLRYYVRSISWEGNAVYPAAVLSARLGFAPGDIYDQQKFELNLRGNETQTDVASLYLDNGYLTFGLDPDIRRVAADSLDIVVRVYERNQYKLGRVEIKGNTKTEDFVIRRELFTRPGDYFNRSQIIRSLRQLSQLNYFNPETLRPDYRINDDGETVALFYEVEERSSDNVNASVGYSDAFGVTGSLGFTINNFAISRPLIGGSGQILNFEWQFGEGARYRTFSVGFTEPWLYGEPTTFGVNVFDTRQIYTYDLRQTGISLRFGRRMRWPDNYFRGDLTLQFQNNDIGLGSSSLYQPGKTTQYGLTVAISRNSTDSPIFPTEGSTVVVSGELAGGPLPGNVNFHKEMFSADFYTRVLGSDRLTLTSHTLFGYLDGFTLTPNTPPIEYFYMGGTGVGYVSTTQLRGYEDRSVGPRDHLFRELGGRVLVKQGVELRLALALSPVPIYILGFAEAGNVFLDFSRADLFDLKRGFGLGARLLINPIGMIGFDYAYGADDVFPLDGRPDGWRFHFQFGKGF